MIQFTAVSFSYGESSVLHDVDLHIPAGLTLLLGPNGCGKSTLLKIAAGVEKPDRGRVTVAGYDLWTQETESRRRLAYLPEQADLTPYATIREILTLVCRLRGVPAEAGLEALEMFGLGDHLQRTVRELSMGQRRRAVYAACFVGEPTVLLLDEPLEGMDLAIQERILQWIDERIAAGAALVVSSHFLPPLAGAAARAVTIRGGRVEQMQELPPQADRKLAVLEALAKGAP